MFIKDIKPGTQFTFGTVKVMPEWIGNEDENAVDVYGEFVYADGTREMDCKSFDPETEVSTYMTTR